MKTYARIDGGKVAEIIDGNEIPIEDRFHPDIVALLVDVTKKPNVAPGWNADLTPPADPVVDEATLMAAYLRDEVRPLREAILTRLAGIGFDTMAAGEPAVDVVAARQRLKDLPQHPAVLAATTHDELRAAVKAAYAEAVAATPAMLRNAFRSIDL